jgi:hypothetical protein
VWLAPAALAIHEVEEWNIGSWFKQHFVDPGYFSLMTRESLWLGLVLTVVVGVVWTALACLPRNQKLVAYLSLPFVMNVGAFPGVAQHVFFLLSFDAYAPGVITALAVQLPVTVFLAAKAMRDRLVPWWYLALCVGIGLPPFLSIIRSGNHMAPHLQRAHLLGMRIAGFVLGTP